MELKKSKMPPKLMKPLQIRSMSHMLLVNLKLKMEQKLLKQLKKSLLVPPLRLAQPLRVKRQEERLLR
jgi:hypothetical protein